MIRNKKKIAYKIINYLKDENSLSVTLTGSYSEHFNLNKAGDIDIVIVCKKLNKSYFKKTISKIKILKKKFFNKKNKLIINSTFGPIKFYEKNSIVFHLMIYDLKSHIEHTIKSPFTCLDWERSKVYKGKSLRKLSPVYNLQLRDFSEARRSVNEYIHDISDNKISYREYVFKNKKNKLVKKYFKIDELNKRDFIYHIIKFLLINFIKYEKQINTKINDNEIEKKFFKISKNLNELNTFKKLKIFKDRKSKETIKNSKKFVLSFIRKFNQYIKKKSESKKIYFCRHKQTRLNNGIFLGQKLNPNIIKKNNKKEFKNIKFDECYSSPTIRCIETAKINSKKNNINVSNFLNEIDYGDAEGLNFNNFKKKYPHIIKKWKQGLDPKFPNGESTSQVHNRLKKFITRELRKVKNHKNNNIVVYTHNVLLRCLIGSSFNIPKKEWFKIYIKHFDLYEFNFEKDRLINNINRNKYLTIFKNFY